MMRCMGKRTSTHMQVGFPRPSITVAWPPEARKASHTAHNTMAQVNLGSLPASSVLIHPCLLRRQMTREGVALGLGRGCLRIRRERGCGCVMMYGLSTVATCDVRACCREVLETTRENPGKILRERTRREWVPGLKTYIITHAPNVKGYRDCEISSELLWFLGSLLPPFCTVSATFHGLTIRLFLFSVPFLLISKVLFELVRDRFSSLL
ncbi:hypothetical protein DM02DRAFT_177549 [Periconia macrospinosa]|uniref:Uncharacterized protein n=1 Tax=Periconia macrospinosa TaxID=97972 RepID=A0A2V1E1L1_9PLEO|nr:hypothetical protein DM02DRAFT_177549 [Periconia macrospinosa]